MALSYEQFFGTGSQTLFTFEFEYLSRSHVKASVDGVAVPFTWAGVYTVQLASPAPVNAVVEVRRTTPRDKRLVTFTDGSTLVASDMNTSTLQAFFLAQEAFDQGAASMAVTEDGQYSAQTRRIALVGDPLNPQDVVTKSWAETAMTSTLALAVAARDVAVVARNTSQAAASTASSERSLAQTARADAQAARDSASGHRLNAYNAQVAAEAARDVTLAARDVTVSAKDITITNRNEAQVFRDQAAQFAQETDGATKVTKVRSLPNADADTCFEEGNYRTTSVWVGSPYTGNNGSNQGYLSVIPWGDNLAYVIQEFRTLNSVNAYWSRRRNNGTWEAWKQHFIGNITVSTAAPSGGADGDIWVQV